MDIRQVMETANCMEEAGVIERYAIGEAVGATFYLEPLATVDVDIFVTLRSWPNGLLLDMQPIYDYLKARGCAVEGEYIVIGGWPVQFLPPTGPLVEEALDQAALANVETMRTRVFTAEHLAAIALQVGRNKDHARLLQFLESGVLDKERFQSILARHGLLSVWERFRARFLEDTP